MISREFWFCTGLFFVFSGLFGMNAVLANTGDDKVNVIQVPRGNINKHQPPVPYGSISRTRTLKESFDEKYKKIYDLLSGNKKLIQKIRKAAARFDIDSVHIIGALVGEHTYNVNALDRMQTYYVKAAAYFGSKLTFRYGKEKITEFVTRPQFSKCFSLSDSYDLWTCREDVWNASFKGKKINGISWPKERFGKVFFQPLYAGQTFGMGQLNPLAALRVTDLVNQKTGFRKLKPERAPEIYREIMDPDSSLNYVAAVIRTSIDAYRNIAHFDISGNPGITATLYNLGNVRNRAHRLKKKNEKRKNTGEKIVYPEENYYGWMVNKKETELRKLLLP